MLSHLHIENVAVISKIDVDFEEGFNVLTGETGAGKSIIIDSINMILGERTSRDLIRSGEEKALVEALFYLDSESVTQVLEQAGVQMEEDNSLLISREIFTNGRNVCRINGRMITSSVLRDVGKLLINIHGQHDNQGLLTWEKHIEFLDDYAGQALRELKEQYGRVYYENTRIKNEIRKISGDEREKERKIDLLTFQIDEIKKARLKPGEEEELTNQKLFLTNAEKVITAVSSAYERLYTGGKNGFAVYDAITGVLKDLKDAEKYDSKLAENYKALEEISYQLDEVIHDIRNYRENLEYEPDQLDGIEQRLDIIFRLKRKYGTSIEDILAYLDQIEQELSDITSGEEKLNKLHVELEKNSVILLELAAEISAIRSEAANGLQQKIMEQLKDLDMAKVQFKVQAEKMTDKGANLQFTPQGCDRVEFLISTNPGEPLKPLVKIASGGEMSRIMLAIKAVLADSDEVQTLIFDEIDIGVSGRAAQRIAEKLFFVGRKKQVLCITHLAQIASMADTHYLIEKNATDLRTNTTVCKLELNDRKQDLARIIGGASITELTLKNAEEMLAIAQEIKQKF